MALGAGKKPRASTIRSIIGDIPGGVRELEEFGLGEGLGTTVDKASEL